MFTSWQQSLQPNWHCLHSPCLSNPYLVKHWVQFLTSWLQASQPSLHWLHPLCSFRPKPAKHALQTHGKCEPYLWELNQFFHFFFQFTFLIGWKTKSLREMTNYSSLPKKTQINFLGKFCTIIIELFLIWKKTCQIWMWRIWWEMKVEIWSRFLQISLPPEN